MAKRILVALTTAPVALIACHSSDDLPTEPPKQITKVTSGGFISPVDAVPSPDGKPGLFSMSIDGGAASTVYSGDPLTSPTGLHIDNDGVSWVMDHLSVGKEGEGVLFAIPADGSKATEVVSNLRMGTPGGVSLVAGGGTAVMPTVDKAGKGQLTEVNIATGERT